MNDWYSNDPEIRKAATYKFWQKMADPELLKACTEDSAEGRAIARKTLEAAGDYESIPDDVEVRVFENDRATSDKLVTILLPEKDKTVDPETFDQDNIWRCSWNLWAQ
jgi:hypothetical protein